MVSGGADSQSPPIDPQNTFETWEVRPSSGTFFSQDSLPSQPGYGTYTGPTPNLEMDWLQEYPRIHLWGDGTMFNSGYAFKP